MVGIAVVGIAVVGILVGKAVEGEGVGPNVGTGVTPCTFRRIDRVVPDIV